MPLSKQFSEFIKAARCNSEYGAHHDDGLGRLNRRRKEKCHRPFSDANSKRGASLEFSVGAHWEKYSPVLDLSKHLYKISVLPVVERGEYI